MNAPAAPVVEARGLAKRFAPAPGAREGTQALHALDLALPAGAISALVGPDGAGKTTFLRLVAGLLRPDAGTLSVLGFDAAREPQAIQDRISYMPQRFGLYEDLSVQENLDLYADLHGVGRQARHERYARLMAMTDLGRFTSRLAGQLSGGMKQKLGLACTLVRSPRLLLLDEPTVGVDPLSRRELWEIVAQLVRDGHLSVVLSTAYLDEAERCAQVFVLHEGRLLAQGPPAALREGAQGRCFIAAPPAGLGARAFQARLLDAGTQVLDAVPQGGEVRFVLRDGAAPDDAALARLLDGAEPRPTPARLEDGFMRLLRERSDSAEAPGTGPAAAQPTPPTRPTPPTPRAPNTPNAPAPPAAAAREVVIEVQDLERRFGDFVAVARSSFQVRRGEIFGLLGPNGAGKTTTFRMLCGLLPASGGRLRVAGVDLRTARAQARARVGYVAQKFSLYGNLTVRENLRFFGGAYGLRGERLRERMDAVLDDFALRPALDTPSGALPGGWRQRLAMATGLLHAPDILFLDEPTSGADPLARRAFWRRITALAQGGTTVVVTTHFMEEAEYCDRILIQDAGRMLAIGTPQAVRAQAGGEARDMEQAFIAIVEAARRAARGPAAATPAAEALA